MGISNDRVKSSAFERRGQAKECDHDGQPMGVRARTRQKAAARAHVNLKPLRFVSLHHHTTYSYLDGYGLPEAHVRRATEINMGTMAFTEHGNVSSHVKAEVAAEKEGIKPIFGCELYTGKVGKGATRKKYHLTVLAATPEGYRNLMQLVSSSFSEGFYSEPTVSWQMLKKYKAGLIILSGCQGSLLFCSAVGGKLVEPEDASYRKAKDVARRFRDEFGDAYYIEVQAFPQLELTRRFNPMAERMGRELGIQVVATKDCHYTAPEEAEIQKVLHNIRPGNKQTLEDQVRSWGYNVPLCPPATDNDIFRELRATGLGRQAAIDAIINTEVIAQRCDVQLPKLPDLRYPVPRGFSDAKEYWRHLLKEGWRWRGLNRLKGDELQRARDMLAKEMRIIEDKGFFEYLLIVRDGIVFAKDYDRPPFEHGIPVGPARGSAAASLACYCLRITEVNPLMFSNLVFERFIDVSRSDPPDVDTDFASEGRPLVRDFYVGKYGPECVNNIGTFTMYKSKNSLDDVAKVHRVPMFKVEAIKGVLIERSSGDLRASATIEDTIEFFPQAAEVVEAHPELRKAMELEGNVKQFGVHAAGLVVSNGDIRDVCAVYEREIKGELLTCVSMDKYDAERQGLMKLDFLSLATMDMIADALRQLDMELIDLYDIPLDDPEVVAGFTPDNCAGIFQFEGQAMRTLCGSVQPDNFDEVCDINALARPGPLHSGASQKYVDIKHGREKRVDIHPALTDITAATHGQIVYQEQILQIVTRIGNFDWTHASHIRRIISKKLGEQEFQRQWHRFWEGAKDLHKRSDYPRMTEDVAKAIWSSCITAGSYAFNAAHCRSYGMLGWWCMWIKQKHPAVFYAASLSKMPKGDGVVNRHVNLMRDAARKDVTISAPDAQRSGITWQAVGDDKLLAGFSQAPKIGKAKSALMIEYRDENEVTGWDDYLKVKGVGDATVQAFKDLESTDDPFGIHKLDRTLGSLKDQIMAGELAGVPYPSHTAIQVPPDGNHDVDVTWMGIIIERNLRDIFESHRARTGEELDESEVRDPQLNEFVVLDGYDGTEVVRIRVDRWKYPRLKRAVWGIRPGKDIVVVQGVRPGWRSAREVYISRIWVIDPEED